MIQLIKSGLPEIQPLRERFLDENKIQFIYNKCYENAWADSWMFRIEGEIAGYGSIWGADRREERDAIFEFYLTAPYRSLANRIFAKLITESGARLIECQSNDPLLTSMLYEYSQNINAEAILFADDRQTDLWAARATFGREPGAANTGNDVAGFFLKQNDVPVATGGFMLNYNWPYADIYMEVNEHFRQKGFGSLIVQELKREIYRMGRVPAARCNISNHASKATLLKAGFKVCGAVLKGDIKQESR